MMMVGGAGGTTPAAALSALPGAAHAAQAPMAAAAPSGAPAPNPRLRATALPTPFAAFPVPGSVPVTLHPLVLPSVPLVVSVLVGRSVGCFHKRG